MSYENSRGKQVEDQVYNFQDYKEKIKEQIWLSLIVPAYNEEDRLPVMLNATIPYFKKKNKNFEIIVVSDASVDNTIKVAKGFQNQCNLKVVNQPINRGKGAAVRSGMYVSQGEYCLMVDADGATEITDFDKVYDLLQSLKKDDQGISAGCRNHLSENTTVKRKLHRKILGYVSNFIIQVICGVKLKDTQCGFKIFTRKTQEQVFKTLHLERWQNFIFKRAFDVEAFMIANHNKIPYSSISVNWQDVDGSKLNVIEASITMTRDFLLVRLLYFLGIWKFTDSLQQK